MCRSTTPFALEQVLWSQCCGVTEIKQLQKLQDRASRIVTGSSSDTPGVPPLTKKVGWRAIYELIASESNFIVFKSLHEVAPQ